jgi:hypothetical protein
MVVTGAMVVVGGPGVSLDVVDYVACQSIDRPDQVVERRVGAKGTPGSPPSSAENYTKLVEVFDAQPRNWGGAFADRDTLVVQYVPEQQSSESAWSVIKDLGIVEGVTLCPSSTSLEDYSSAMTSAAETLTFKAGVAGYGPQYDTGAIVVDVFPGAARADLELALPDMSAPFEFRTETGQPEPASRYYDSVQYWGGVEFKNLRRLRDNGQQCRRWRD